MQRKNAVSDAQNNSRHGRVNHRSLVLLFLFFLFFSPGSLWYVFPTFDLFKAIVEGVGGESGYRI